MGKIVRWLKRLTGWGFSWFTWFFTPTQAWALLVGGTAIVIALLQGMTLAGAFIFTILAVAATVVLIHYGLKVWDRLKPRKAVPAIRDRVSVVDAALFMFFNDWKHSADDVHDPERLLVLYGTNLGQMVQDAADGHLEIYIKRQRHGGHCVSPGKGYWQDKYIDWMAAANGAVLVRSSVGHRIEETYDPRVRKSDIEKLYG